MYLIVDIWDGKQGDNMRRATAAVHCTGHGMRIGLDWAGPGDCDWHLPLALPTPAHGHGHGIAKGKAMVLLSCVTK